MANIKITTFNCENLYGRYRFLDKPWNERPDGYERLIQVSGVISLKRGRKGAIEPKKITEKQRKSTAEAILATLPDILVVQEIENIQTLRLFNCKYCNDYFDRIILLDGNDPRGIDVGVLIKRDFDAEILNIRTHADEALGGKTLKSSSRLNTKSTAEAIFSRDCLEVDIKIDGKTITLLVNHFKAQDGKPSSTKKRQEQSKKVKEIAARAINEGKMPIVLGDLNIDIKQKNYDGSLNEIYNYEKLDDPFKNKPEDELWSHYYSSDNKVSRLDYILVDKKLNVISTDFFRNGLTPDCKQYTGTRLESMKGNDLEASDHCPTSVIIDL
ncbi:MAG: endonuclease/exonuclease/phosphatase family protein [Bacteroidales bacterium]|nr:endonuclease/exonuclease/phosphatase family protein [Bacteroidales bacterium]